jgi:beta-barrel assembly-enhancing protease
MPPRFRLPLWRRAIALLLIASLPIGGHAQSSNAGSGTGLRLPTLGDSVSEDLDVAAERRLGDQVMREIRRDPDVLDDPLLLAYVQAVWEPLLAAARRRGDIGVDLERNFAWEALLIRDRSVNAFALPGGYVGVHLGLIAVTSSRDELAAVLAHELAHVTQRHIARGMANASRQSLVGLAAMIAAVAVATQSRNATVAQAGIVGGQALMLQGQLNFSREMEREADRVGFGIYTGAAHPVTGVAAMFERLESANRLNDNGAFPYLRTHPLTVERIGDARSRIEAAGAPQPAPASVEHDMMRARARVLMDGGVESLRLQQASATATAPATTSASASGERVAQLYASALASLQLREASRALDAAKAAEAQLRALPRREPRAEAALRLVHAQALAQSGEGARALAALDAQDDGSRPSMLARAAVAAEVARSAGANAPATLRPSLESLQAWVADHRHDALAWSQLARVSELMGLRLRALRADAEARAALGDLTGAIDRLRAGQRLARDGAGGTDAIEASVIDARARELSALHRELYPDARTRP